MKKRPTRAKKPVKKTVAARGFVIGHSRFAKISAVEGIALTGAMKARRSQMDRTGASAAERRAAIIKAYKP